ncbi:protein kinase [bacterium]|nr:protein kinase [bacterium]
MSLAPGTRLGTYEIASHLGAGGMGEVYRAKDLRLGREVALKVLPAGVAADAGRLARFEREARAVAALNHPNIVVLYAVEDEGDVRFLTMELVEGLSLDRHVTSGGLPLTRVVEIGIALSDALTAAHEKGVVHRDLKPGNVMLTREGRVKVLDFGLAKLAAAEPDLELTQPATLSTPGLMVGTVPYMSPEQVRGEEVDARSDLFALGIILYELATGRRPFAGATAADVSSSILRDAPDPLPSVRPDLPGDLERIVSRCLEKNPRERFQTALDVGNELRRVGSVPDSMLRTQPEAAGAPEAASIAVLPFANLSSDPENGYFADGLTEEVILMLSHVEELRVSSRTSVMPYRDRADSPAQIARDLGVTHLLEGSVRKSGPRIRIAVSLLDAKTDRSLWAEKFDGTMDDVFDMQDRVAQATVHALELTLTPHEQAKLLDHPIRNAEAYDAYLRAREELGEFTVSGLANAMQHLERASDLEPDNVFVLRGLGRACWAAINHGLSDDISRLDQALAYADDIARLSPESPYVHEIRGLVAIARGDVETGLRNLSVAHEAMPADEDIGTWYGILLFFSSRLDAATVVARDVLRTHESGITRLLLHVTDMFRGRPESVIAGFDGGPQNFPQAPWGLFQLVAGLAAGDHAHVQRAAAFARSQQPGPLNAMGQFLGEAARGDRAAALVHLTPAVEGTLWNDFQYTECVAEGFAVLGDVPNVVRWLGRSVDLGMSYIGPIVETHAVWREWVAHPEVAPLLARSREHVARYAAIPLAPRVAALLSRGE